MRALAFALIALSLAALGGCEDPAKKDAASVLEAIHRFRVADNDSIPAMVDALHQTPCNADDTCRAKDECAHIGDATAKALRLKNEVELGLAAIEKGTLAKDSPEALTFEKKLDDASALLKEGHDGLPRCDDAVMALKRKYGI